AKKSGSFSSSSTNSSTAFLPWSMVAMLDVACEPRKWLSSILDHASDRRTPCGHRSEILWADDIVGQAYGILCEGCGTRFTVDLDALRHHPGSDIVDLRLGIL